MKAVSYTHLDVYKRQGHNLAAAAVDFTAAVIIQLPFDAVQQAADRFIVLAWNQIRCV